MTKETAVQERGEVMNFMPHTHTVWKNRKETTKRRGYCTYSRYFKIFLKIIEVRFVKFEVPTHFEQWTTWNLFYCGASTFCWTIFDCSGKPWRCHESWCFQHRWTTGDYRCKEIKRLSVFEVWRFLGPTILHGHIGQQERLLTCVAWCLVDKAKHSILELPMCCVELFWTTSNGNAQSAS